MLLTYRGTTFPWAVDYTWQSEISIRLALSRSTRCSDVETFSKRRPEPSFNEPHALFSSFRWRWSFKRVHAEIIPVTRRPILDGNTRWSLNGYLHADIDIYIATQCINIIHYVHCVAIPVIALFRGVFLAYFKIKKLK